MSKAIFRGKTGITKRHDYKAGVKFTLKRTKTVSKGKPVGEVKPMIVKFNTGSMFIHRVSNGTIGANAIVMPNTKRTKQYKRARTTVK